MKTSMMSATLGVGLLSVSAGAAILAAPGQKYQDYTGRPGDPTPLGGRPRPGDRCGRALTPGGGSGRGPDPPPGQYVSR